MVEEVEDIAAEKEVEISATAGYVFLREVDYDPNGRHYIIGEKSQLTDWTPEHIESALSVGLIAEEVEYG